MKVSDLGRAVLWVVAALLLVAAVFFGMDRLRSDPVVLQNYEVPTEIAGEVRSALRGALSQGESTQPLGRVTLMPNGRLLVTAPLSLQKGVGRIVRDIVENKPGPTPTIGFDIWIVTATPGKDAKTSDALAEVEPALAIIRKNKGPLNFNLLEKVSTITRSGEDRSQVRGASAQVEIGASIRKDEEGRQIVAAEVRIMVFGGVSSVANLEARSEMRPGELLVVGQSALAAPDTNRQVYYIVRASL